MGWVLIIVMYVHTLEMAVNKRMIQRVCNALRPTLAVVVVGT
jgi:hypothetical protein